MEVKNTIEVCLSNDLIKLYDLSGKLVVFIDIFRNTSAITSALYHGIKKVKPVRSVDQAEEYIGKPGHIVAGERNGRKIRSFDASNSPVFFRDRENNEQVCVITSTNGTQSVHISKGAAKIVCGGFVNQEALIEYLRKSGMPVLLLASGWKGQVNIEDTLFAGSIVHQLKEEFEIKGDPAHLAEIFYSSNKNNLKAVIDKASYQGRIESELQVKDVPYCISLNVAPCVPVFDGEYMVLE